MAMSWTFAGLLGSRKWSQRLGLHALSGCDSLAPLRKRKEVDTQAHGERDTWSQSSAQTSADRRAVR